MSMAHRYSKKTVLYPNLVTSELLWDAYVSNDSEFFNRSKTMLTSLDHPAKDSNPLQSTLNQSLKLLRIQLRQSQ